MGHSFPTPALKPHFLLTKKKKEKESDQMLYILLWSLYDQRVKLWLQLGHQQSCRCLLWAVSIDTWALACLCNPLSQAHRSPDVNGWQKLNTGFFWLNLITLTLWEICPPSNPQMVLIAIIFVSSEYCPLATFPKVFVFSAPDFFGNNKGKS